MTFISKRVSITRRRLIWRSGSILHGGTVHHLVIKHRQRVDDERPVAVLCAEQVGHQPQQNVDVHCTITRPQISAAAVGQFLHVLGVLRAAFGVNQHGAGELNRGGGLARSGNAVEQDFEPFLNRGGFL
jgi:hypothetical protein